MKAINITTNKEIACNLTVAQNLLRRMKGLLGASSIPAGKGLLLKPCMGVHTFGMTFPIDVLFLDKGNHVIAVITNLQPNRISRLYLNAASALELPAGIIEATATSLGDKIDIV